MKYKKIILKPIFNYIPENKKDSTENETMKISNHVNNFNITQQNNTNNVTLEKKKNKSKDDSILQKNNLKSQSSYQNKDNLTLNKENIKYLKKDNLTKDGVSLKDNLDYIKILQETDKLIKKLKNISSLKENTINNLSTNSKNNKTVSNPKFTEQFLKIIGDRSTTFVFRHFLEGNKYLFFFELTLLLFLLFIILKFIRSFFKKKTIPEELIYITIKDPFEEAIEKTKTLPKIGTLIVKSSEDIPSSVYVSGNLIIMDKVKLPEYVYVKGDVVCENYVEIDTLISEKNIKILKGGFLNTLLAAKKSIYLSKDFESKGILIAEQIVTYDYKEYDFNLPISSSKGKILKYKGNFKVPGEITLAQDLIIFGNLEILPFAKILGNVKVYGNVKLWNNVKISGGIYASGKVTLMNNCIVGKDLISANNIEVYPGCRLNIFSGRIATYKNIIFNKDICAFGPIISSLKVK